jgi:hypothetical protein
MNLADLRNRLRQLGVQPQDTYRAALYIDYLNAADTYFKTTLAGTVPAGGLGAGYRFVAPALGSADLLQQLADILDYFVSPAIDADLRRAFAPPPGGLGHGPPAGWTYQDYFTNLILDNNAVTFGNNVQAFRLRYPISAEALLRLSANFKGNIIEACQRVIADTALLTAFYEDLYERDFNILSLQKIKSTGSDFHKGGKQVLILTFQIVHTVDYPTGPIPSAPIRELLKIVYKPSDLETDCLIAGDSATINRVLGIQFMAASLFEIYNRRLQLIKTNNPAFTGEPVATYRILPRNYMSAYGGGPPLPVRNAYGYIQYLDNDLSGTAARVYGYYPFGASDYLIFKSQDKNAIVGSFYRQEGAITALCGSFSLIDLHFENVRVMTYKPYLIDMEISLTTPIANIEGTSLLGSKGGITGISFMGQEATWVVKDAALPGKAFLEREYPTVYYQNRLWFAVDGRQKKTIAVSRRYLLQGFADGMSVLQACQQNNEFQAWFARLNNVLVRYLTYTTGKFREIRNNIFIGQLGTANPGAPLNTTQDTKLRNVLTVEYENFQQAGNTAGIPDFVSLTQPVCSPDFLNLDIPIFYHRIGTIEIVDSRGVQVPIPGFVTIDNPPGTRQARVLGPGGVLNRATFFANQPTTNVVDQGQVQILVGAGFAPRVNMLRGTIVHALGNNTDNPPSKIVDVDKFAAVMS